MCILPKPISLLFLFGAESVLSLSVFTSNTQSASLEFEKENRFYFPELDWTLEVNIGINYSFRKSNAFYSTFSFSALPSPFNSTVSLIELAVVLHRTVPGFDRVSRGGLQRAAWRRDGRIRTPVDRGMDK